MAAFGGVFAARDPQEGRSIAARLAGRLQVARVVSRGPASLICETAAGAEGSLLAWNGRLDSRGGSHVSVADADLVVALLERGGQAALRGIIGDFSLAFWDASSGDVLLARDPFGTRPLYYAVTSSGVAWSTELMPLVDAAGIPRDIDDAYIGGFLIRGAPHDRSPFRGVHRVSPGHAVRIGTNGVHSEPFWQPDFDRPVVLRDDREYEERFLELFRESVRCRMRTGGPVAAELSGGVDSSSIVVMADDVLRRGEAAATGLQTVSYVFDQATTSDERPFITVIEEHRGSRGHHSNEVEHPLFAPVPWDEVGELPTPNYAGHRRNEDLRRHMGAIGARVLLSGFAGDQIFWGDTRVSPVISDQVRSLRIADAFRSMNAWAPHQREPYSRFLWSTMVQPFVPARLRRLTNNERFIGDWLDSAFIRAHGLRARGFGWSGERQWPLPSQREAYSSLQDAIAIVSNASSLGRDQFHTAYPFLHRPLVEFALAIPIGQHLRPGETRSLMRRALRGLLPDPIRLRTSKQGPGEAVYRAVVREWPRLRALAADARVTRRGYVRAGAFENMLDTARRGLPVNIPALLRTVSLEYWLRSLEHSRGGEVQPEIHVSPVMQLVEGRG